MCGIAGFYVRNREGINVERLTDELLLGIEHRGTDATGILAVSEGGESVTLQKDDIPASYFVQTRDWLPKNLRMVLGHTRLATQGLPKFMENNHPVQYRTCFATHNGMIYNDSSIVDDVLGEDEKRPAEVDSIAIPMLVAKCGFAAALDNIEKLEGSWAIAVADPINNPDELLLARGHSSPLVFINHPKILIWASTRTAISDAWEKAIGTPPDYKKFDYLDEGRALVVNVAGEVKEQKFMDARGWGYNKRTWNISDEELDNMTGYSSYPASYNGQPVGDDMCWECGEKVSYFHVIDSHTDEESGEHTAWSVNVCYQCKEDYKGPGSLSYRFAGDNKVKLHHMKRGDRCYWCTRDNAVMFTDKWDKTCEECVAFHAKEFKQFASVKGGDPNTDTILSLQEGDIIPEEMQYAFQGCESCGSTKAEVIGMDGFPLCFTCREGEKLGSETDDISTCDVCGEMTLLGLLKQTMWGRACALCRSKEAIAKRREGESETQAPVQRKAYDYCIECQEAFITSALVDTSDGLYCKECVDKEPAPRCESDSGADPFKGYISEAELAMKLKFRACLETGWELNVPGHFVLWLLEECPDGYCADPALSDLRNEARKAFPENHAIITELVRCGRDDLIESVPLGQVARTLGMGEKHVRPVQ